MVLAKRKNTCHQDKFKVLNGNGRDGDRNIKDRISNNDNHTRKIKPELMTTIVASLSKKFFGRAMNSSSTKLVDEKQAG